MFTDLKREWIIRRALKKLSRQRVVGIMQPGNVWVIEKALMTNEKTEPALRTCFMRGWIDILEDRVLHGAPLPDGTVAKPWFQTVAPTWKLTDSGWAAIQRTHEWELIGILIATLSLYLALK